MSRVKGRSPRTAATMHVVTPGDVDPRAWLEAALADPRLNDDARQVATMIAADILTNGAFVVVDDGGGRE